MSLDKNKHQTPEGQKIKVLEFIIEGKSYQTPDQYKTGQELKQLAGIPLDTELYLSLEKPWVDELIENHIQVDLARPGIEYFFVKKKLQMTINGRSFDWYKQYITGRQIRELGKIDPQEDIFLDIKEPYEDELITDDTKVDLARPSKEHFITKEKAVHVVVVNGKEKPWTEKTISFEQVVRLAFPNYSDNANIAYTVTYKRGPEQKPEGTMVKGDVIRVKNKMIFNVTATDKS